MTTKIDRKKKEGRLSLAAKYQTSLNSLRRFLVGRLLPFDGIDTSLTLGYETYLKNLGLCPDTTSFYLRNLRAIVYAIGIAHAEHIAGFYRQQGVNAVAISSKTPKDVRKRIIDYFRNSPTFENFPVPSCSEEGLHLSLLNPLSPQEGKDLKPGRLGLYGQQGFDCADVKFVQLARPTLSLASMTATWSIS